MLKHFRWTSLSPLLAGFILFATVHATAYAQGGCITGGGGCTPEVDPSLSSGGLALLGGVLLLIRSRRRQ